MNHSDPVLRLLKARERAAELPAMVLTDAVWLGIGVVAFFTLLFGVSFIHACGLVLVAWFGMLVAFGATENLRRALL